MLSRSVLRPRLRVVYPVALLVAIVATLASLIVWSEIQWAERRSKRDSTGPRAISSEQCHWPYFIDDGERCHVNWEWQAWQDRGYLTVTGNTTLGDASSDTMTLAGTGLVADGMFEPTPTRPTIHRIDNDDTITIHDGAHTVLFDGALPGAKIHAPNTYRDGAHCYSLNVLHVDGTRVPVECPK
jgi:hypothetical protein